MVIAKLRPPKMFFCERSFGILFVLWGIVLIIGKGSILPIREGIFFSYLEQYMSGRCWGMILLIIGMSRWVAFRFQSAQWRINLSLVSLIFLTVIATIAIYTRLWSATAPLACFSVYVAFWCHRAMIRDLRE